MLFLITSTVVSSQTHVFSIKSPSNDCSATFFKSRGKCSLVTNAHCLQKNDKKVLLTGLSLEEQQDFSISNRFSHGRNFLVNSNDAQRSQLKSYESNFFKSHDEITLDVVKVDYKKDLAELALSPQMEGLCASIEESIYVDEVPSESSIAFAGYSRLSLEKKPHPKVWYSNGSVVDNDKITFSLRELKKVPSTLSDLDHFLEISDIEMIFGQSGRVAVDSSANLLGITTRFHATQDKVYLIDLPSIIDFLEKSESNEPDFLNGDNATHNGGGNGAGNGGGNGAGNGGGNGAGNGGGCNLDERNDAFSIFREPYEGFINELGQIVLNIDGNQIDGSDDLLKYAGGANVIARQADDYPAQVHRQEILQRLSGDYQFLNATHKIYEQDASFVLGWEQLQRNELQGNLSIKGNEIELKFDRYASSVNQDIVNSSVAINIFPSSTYKFTASLNEDSKTVTLEDRQGNSYKCDNRHYLKLICSGERADISISRAAENSSKVSFRFVKKGNAFANYFFGESN